MANNEETRQVYDDSQIQVLEGVEDIAVHAFSDRDVVRHKLVQRIIRAYEKYENNEMTKKSAPAKYRAERKGPQGGDKA